MKKIVIFTGTLSHGGSERVISTLCHEFINIFDKVEIILFYNMPIFYNMPENITVTTIDDYIDGKVNIVKKLLWLRSYIRKNKVDLVLSFLAPFNMFAILSLLGNKTPLIVAERNDPRHIPNKKSMRLMRNILYNFSSRIIVQTENNKEYFNSYIKKKTDIIYNPISLGTNKGKALITPKNKKIVSVGRLIQQKNQKMMIDAFSSVIQKYPDYKLVIYGEGELRPELEQLIKEYKLENSVYLPGVKKDIHQYIKDAEMFLLTSKFEGMPNALIEAMCLGLPCISTKVSGAVDLIKNGENGLLVDLDDTEELIANIEKIIEDNEYAFELGKKASFLNEELSVARIADKWLNTITCKIKNN